MPKQIILHIPHSSSIIPFKEGYVADDAIIENEILKLTDLHTDDLFHSNEEIMVVYGFSRIFCDPERFPDDQEEVMAKYGMGVLYEKTDSGILLRKVTPELRQKILTEYYWQHHNRLNNAVKTQLNQYSQALILDCHSFPNIPFHRDLNKEPNRPDFNIGTDSFHAPQKLIDFSTQFFAGRNYSLGINTPYSGSIVPLEYYKKNKNVQSIMLEVNRKLYLKPDSNEKSDNYDKTKQVVQEYIKMIKSVL